MNPNDPANQPKPGTPLASVFPVQPIPPGTPPSDDARRLAHAREVAAVFNGRLSDASFRASNQVGTHRPSLPSITAEDIVAGKVPSEILNVSDAKLLQWTIDQVKIEPKAPAAATAPGDSAPPPPEPKPLPTEGAGEKMGGDYIPTVAEITAAGYPNPEAFRENLVKQAYAKLGQGGQTPPPVSTPAQ